MTIGIFFASTILTVIALVISQKIFIRRNIIDKINPRSSHSVTATRNGGIAIFTSICCISTFYYIQGIDLFNYSFLVPLSILVIVGCYDDMYNVDFKLKFLFQIIAAKILIDNGYFIDNLHGFMGIDNLDRISAQLLSMFIIVAIINAINFIDGIDGLALTVVSLFIALFELLSINNSGLFYLSIIFFGSVIPMLYFNFKKNNKIFLGDSGSLFIGAITSVYVMYILSSEYLIKESYDINKLFFVISILVYPIADISRITLLRLYKKVSPFQADKNHIHHLLLKKFNKHGLVVIIILVSSILNFIIIHNIL